MCLAEALLRIPDAATRDALIRDKIARRLARACRAQPVAVRQRRDLGPGAHRQARRDQQRADLSARADAPHRARRRADHPQGRRRRDAADGRAVRHRPDHRGGARTRAASARRAASPFPTTCSAKRRRPPTTRRAIYADTSTRSTPSARPRAGAASTKGRASRSSSRRCIRAISRTSATRVMSELLPRVQALAALAQVLRHRPQHRRRGGRSARTVARSARGAVPRPRARGLERPRLRRPGLRQALPVRDRLARSISRAARGRRLMVRLVKGAYWDSRDQARAGRRPGRLSGLHAQGLHRRLLSRLRAKAARRAGRGLSAVRHPQRADAGLAFSPSPGPNFYRGQYEFQCLHGMGEPLYEEVVGRDKLDRPCRVYAPVGTHETLLAYLVRRLLENGANTSFVNRIADETCRSRTGRRPGRRWRGDPRRSARRTRRSRCRAISMAPSGRIRAGSIFPTSSGSRAWRRRCERARTSRAARLPPGAAPATSSGEPVRNPADQRDVVGTAPRARRTRSTPALAAATAAAPAWARDAAERARRDPAPRGRPARGADRRCSSASSCAKPASPCQRGRRGARGGRLPALLRGAKPRERSSPATPRAARSGRLHQPVEFSARDLHRPGRRRARRRQRRAREAGRRDAADRRRGGARCCTKPACRARRCSSCRARAKSARRWSPIRACRASCSPARRRSRASSSTSSPGASTPRRRAGAADRRDRRPERDDRRFLGAARAGGRATCCPPPSIRPASAARRCASSACRRTSPTACSTMLKGAMARARGRRSRTALDVDVGPVITAEARDAIDGHVEAMRARGSPVTQRRCRRGARSGTFVAPTLIEIGTVADVEREVFGPVLHVLRYRREAPRSTDRCDQRRRLRAHLRAAHPHRRNDRARGRAHRGRQRLRQPQHHRRGGRRAAVRRRGALRHRAEGGRPALSVAARRRAAASALDGLEGAAAALGALRVYIRLAPRRPATPRKPSAASASSRARRSAPGSSSPGRSASATSMRCGGAAGSRRSRQARARLLIAARRDPRDRQRRRWSARREALRSRGLPAELAHRVAFSRRSAGRAGPGRRAVRGRRRRRSDARCDALRPRRARSFACRRSRRRGSRPARITISPIWSRNARSPPTSRRPAATRASWRSGEARRALSPGPRRGACPPCAGGPDAGVAPNSNRGFVDARPQFRTVSGGSSQATPPEIPRHGPFGEARNVKPVDDRPP